MIVPSSALSVRRTIHAAPLWSPLRAPALPIIVTVVCPAKELERPHRAKEDLGMNREDRSEERPLGPSFGCPVGRVDHAQILLGHGGGGLLTHRLLEQVFRPAFTNPLLDARHDGAVLTVGSERLAFTTDSYVVRPLFFPGGDIGTLAVNGTINDLTMCGARPLFLSVAFILEEGLPIDTLRRVVQSMSTATAAAGVRLVTGDTKVVDRGKGDGVYVNTAGIGVVEHAARVGPASVQPGDVILLSGDLGRHGIAIMAAR